MGVNLMLLAERFKKYRENWDFSISELSNKTGISEERLTAFEAGFIEPTGDELLIVADVFKIDDYRVFLSPKGHQAPFEQVQTLFRKFGQELITADRRAIQEVLYLAECESFLEEELNKTKRSFSFRKTGLNFKLHGEKAALSLRKHLGYNEGQQTKDVFQDIRSLGVHIFRRRLVNSTISGVFIKHPSAGSCILINYNEDVYRQRFTAAHELGHSILDLAEQDEADITSAKYKRDHLIEVRGNSFASNYLLPSTILSRIHEKTIWNAEKIKKYANYFDVNPETLAYALARDGYIKQIKVNELKTVKVVKTEKVETELNEVSTRGRLRRTALLEQGISEYYVRLCFDARRNGIISSSRMAEMLLLDYWELKNIYEMFGEAFYD
jgi:Zn-dependent peptidase ImmA (M78 family)